MNLAHLAAQAARWAANRRGSRRAPALTPPRRPTPPPDARLAEGMLLVEEVARRLKRRLGIRVQFDELISIGHEALVAILQQHDPTRAPFCAFAVPRLRWAILDGLRRETHSRAALRIVTELLEKDDSSTATRLPSPAPTPEAEVEQADLAHAARAAAFALPARERALIERHAHGEELQVIARDLGISKGWASRLHGRALIALRSAINAERSGEA